MKIHIYSYKVNIIQSYTMPRNLNIIFVLCLITSVMISLFQFHHTSLINRLNQTPINVYNLKQHSDYVNRRHNDEKRNNGDKSNDENKINCVEGNNFEGNYENCTDAMQLSYLNNLCVLYTSEPLQTAIKQLNDLLECVEMSRLDQGTTRVWPIDHVNHLSISKCMGCKSTAYVGLQCNMHAEDYYDAPTRVGKSTNPLLSKYFQKINYQKINRNPKILSIIISLNTLDDPIKAQLASEFGSFLYPFHR